MEILKKYLPIFVLLGIFLVLLLPSFFLLNRKIDERKTVKASLDDKMRQREDLWRRKPSFPSKENVDRVKKNADEEKKKIASLIENLGRSHLTFSQKSGSEVKEQLVVSWRRMSQILDENQVKHPDKFQFGFERYDKLPPKDPDTVRILTQLEIVDDLIQLLAKARVSELVSVRRVVFEDIPKPDPKAPPPPAAPWEPVVSMGGKMEIGESPAHVYNVMPFELEFWCDTDSLRAFLNSLAVSKYVYLPRLLIVENEKKEPILQASAPAGGVKTATATETNKWADPFQLPFVMGMERIKVGMRVEWLDFPPDKSTAKSAPKPGAPNAR